MMNIEEIRALVEAFNAETEVDFTFAQRAEMFKKIVEKVAKELELEVSAGWDNDSEIVVYDKIKPYVENSNGIRKPNYLGWDSIVGDLS